MVTQSSGLLSPDNSRFNERDLNEPDSEFPMRLGNPTPNSSARAVRPWQPRFGILGMLLLMLVVCAMATAGYYFVQTVQGGRQDQLAFILFTVASPLLLLVMVSVGVAFLKRTRPRPPNKP